MNYLFKRRLFKQASQSVKDCSFFLLIYPNFWLGYQPYHRLSNKFTISSAIAFIYLLPLLSTGNGYRCGILFDYFSFLLGRLFVFHLPLCLLLPFINQFFVFFLLEASQLLILLCLVYSLEEIMHFALVERRVRFLLFLSFEEEELSFG